MRGLHDNALRRGGRELHEAWASGSFLPNDIAGLALWLRADMGLAQSANVLTSWTDQANGLVFSAAPTGNTLPGYSAIGGPNGRPAVTFSGSQSLVSTTANPLSSGNGTVFFTIKSAVAAQNPAYIGFFGTNTTLVLACLGVRDLRVAAGDTGSAGNVTTNWEEWTAQVNGANQSLRWNGGNQVTNTLAASSAQSGGTGIGDFITKSHSFNGSIWEIIAYNRALTLSEIMTVEAYVRGITGAW